MEELLKSLEKQNASLSDALASELALSKSLSEALRLEQTRSHRLAAKMLKLEAELVRPILGLMFDRVRAAGNRLTGGGLRSLGKRALEKVVHRAMASPAIRAVVRRVLQPWPKTSVRLSQLGASAQSASAKPTGNTLRSLIWKSRPNAGELTPSASSIYAKLAVAYEKRAWNDIR
jgi:hypothetical protein